MIPFIRAKDYLESNATKRFDEKTMEMLTEELNGLRRRDVKEINKEGIIDFDLFMLKCFFALKASIAGNLDAYKAIFNAFDLDKDGTIAYKEIEDVYTIIEANGEEVDNKTWERLKQAYCFYSGEIYKPYRRKIPGSMTINQFVMMCVDLDMFTNEKVLSKCFIGLQASCLMNLSR